jgi:hypothetical protein
MPQYGTWVSYGGAARIVLAIVLVAAAGGVAYAGTLLPLPLRPARPGETAKTFMLVIWGFAIAAFLVCLPYTFAMHAGSTCITARHRLPFSLLRPLV